MAKEDIVDGGTRHARERRLGRELTTSGSEQYRRSVTEAEVGGDTDTIASMTGAIVGAHLGAEALPQGWVRRLEGADRIVELADRLLTLGAADVNP